MRTKNNLALIGQCGSKGRLGLVRTQEKSNLEKKRMVRKENEGGRGLTSREGQDGMPKKSMLRETRPLKVSIAQDTGEKQMKVTHRAKKSKP